MVKMVMKNSDLVNLVTLVVVKMVMKMTRVMIIRMMKMKKMSSKPRHALLTSVAERARRSRTKGRTERWLAIVRRWRLTPRRGKRSTHKRRRGRGSIYRRRRGPTSRRR